MVWTYHKQENDKSVYRSTYILGTTTCKYEYRMDKSTLIVRELKWGRLIAEITVTGNQKNGDRFDELSSAIIESVIYNQAKKSNAEKPRESFFQRLVDPNKIYSSDDRKRIEDMIDKLIEDTDDGSMKWEKTSTKYKNAEFFYSEIRLSKIKKLEFELVSTKEPSEDSSENCLLVYLRRYKHIRDRIFSIPLKDFIYIIKLIKLVRYKLGETDIDPYKERRRSLMEYLEHFEGTLMGGMKDYTKDRIIDRLFVMRKKIKDANTKKEFDELETEIAYFSHM